MIRSGLNAVFALQSRWHLTPDQLAKLLGLSSGSVVKEWKVRLPDNLAPDAMERMGLLLAIYHALERIRGGDRSEQWLRSPNEGVPFKGEKPLDYMGEGPTQKLRDTYFYLKEAAGGGF